MFIVLATDLLVRSLFLAVVVVVAVADYKWLSLKKKKIKD
jgi:hypothetical protein